ncbi:MAG: FtsX-like permease family protein [Alphaproteobacteria bacterium]|nr:FtsX-like permease family protein [Alphaproteobacteria bacterium]
MRQFIAESLFVATRQLRHRGRQAGPMLAGVGVAIVLMFMQLGFRNSLYESAVGVPRAVSADLFVTNALYESMTVVPPWFPRSTLHRISAIDGVATARPLYVQAVDVSSPSKGVKMGSWMLAYDLRQPVFLAADINQAADLLKLPNAVLLDSRSRFEYQTVVARVRNGETPSLTLPQGSATLSPYLIVAGLFTQGPTFFADGLMITSDLNYYRWMQTPLDRLSLGLVTLDPATDPQEMKQRIQTAVGDGLRVLTRQEFLDQERNFFATRTPIGTIFNFGLLVGMVVGVVFISQVLQGIVEVNIREYAVLSTMGYRESFLGMIVLEISLIVAVVTFIPSFALSVLLYHLAANATTLPLAMTLESAVTVFGAVLCMGVLASLIAMRKLKKSNPLDLFS